jgi:phosphoribosylaminoimidazole-succinocarboxamide synthase
VSCVLLEEAFAQWQIATYDAVMTAYQQALLDYEERLARGEAPRSLDKEYVRRWLVDERGYSGDGTPPTLPDEVRIEAARRYIDTFELITGRQFEPATGDPAARIAANLGVK